MILTRCYKYRLYPTTDQHKRLIQWAGCRRYVWNWALHHRQVQYKTTGLRPTYAKLCLDLTVLKQQSDMEWLRDCSAQMLQQVLRDLDQAFNNFFEKRAKYPM